MSLPVTSDFTLLGQELETLLAMDAVERQAYLAGLPRPLAEKLEALLEFEHATLDLSCAPGIGLALDVLADAMPDRIGRWRVLALLGRGGMASVYLVEREEEGLRQRAACKIGYARADLEDGIRRETRTLLDLGHPGIVPVLDFGHTESGRPFLVSEWVDGEPLVAWAQARGLGLEARLAVFGEVLAAVAHAHDRLLLHQDIKPGNVLVDATGRVRLIDFGLAAVLVGGAPVSGRGYTPSYASPEQAAGLPLSLRSDIYSLGATLAELLKGLPRSDAWRDACAVADRASRPCPEDRHASVSEMAAELLAIRHFRPIRSRPAGLMRRARLFLRRHPLPSALAGMAVASLLAGSGVALWQAHRAFAAVENARVALAANANVIDFLTDDLLGRANPASIGYAPDMSVAALVDQAAASVDARFAEEPLAMAAVKGALGAAYRSLGRYAEAHGLAEASADLYAGILGPGHDLTLISRYLDVRALASQQRFDEADAVLVAADALAGERLAQPVPLALQAVLARGLLAENRLDGEDSLAMFTRAAALRAQLAPGDRSMEGFITASLGEAYLRLGQPADAVALWQDAPLEQFAQAHRIAAERQLARAYRGLGDLERAALHGRNALALFARFYGEESYHALVAASTLSYIEQLRGHCDAALALGRRAYEGMRNAYGPTRQASLIEGGNLAAKLVDCGQQAEGFALGRRVVDDLRMHYGPDNPALHSFARGLALALVKAGRPAEALAELDALPDAALRDEEVDDALARVRAAFGENAPPAASVALLARIQSRRSSPALADEAGPGP